jgi:hypothetical protein
MAAFEANYFFYLLPKEGGGPNEYTPNFVGAGPFAATNGDAESTTFEPGQAVYADLSGGTPDQFSYLGQYGHGWIGQYTLTDPETGETFGSFQALFTNDCLCGTETVTVDPAAFVVCFLEGTRIGCPGGERAVESLAAGDLILTASGETRAVRWIGRQSVVAVFASPLHHYPIRIAAGALADHVPTRDLFVSPGHALLIDGLLVQANALVNGTSITRVVRPAPRFTWFHIETEDHAVILAEGTPAETFVDNVTRGRFDNHAEFEALYGTPQTSIMELDQPRVKSARQLPRAIRERLALRAGGLALAS